VIWPPLGVTIKLFADVIKLYYVFDNAMSPMIVYSLVCQLYLPGQTTGNLNWHHLNAVSYMLTVVPIEILTRTIHTALEN